MQTRKDEDFEFHIFKQWTAASCENIFCNPASNGSRDTGAWRKNHQWLSSVSSSSGSPGKTFY